MIRRRSLGLALAVFTAGALGAADVRWPPLSGDLSGVVRLDALGGAPPLTWRAQMHPTADGLPSLELDVTATGLVLHARATLPSSADAPGAWRVTEATIDLATWLPVALARAGTAALPPDLAMTGNLRLTGEGTWREAEVSGALMTTLDDATGASAAQNWSMSGLAVEADLTLTKNLPAMRAVKLSVDTFHMSNITAHKIMAEAGSASGGRLEVRRAELAVLGGHVALAPFTFDPAAPAIDTTADLADVALGDLASLLPQALTAATGQIAGRLAVRWSATAGAEPGSGTLRIGVDQPATVRLAASPGFLTQRVPERFNLAGTALGPISRALSLKNPAYDTLRRIELGETPLNVDSLEVKLYPDGPDGIVSARVAMSGRPAESDSPVGKVSFVVNVVGPLEKVIRLSAQKNSSMSFGTGK